MSPEFRIDLVRLNFDQSSSVAQSASKSLLQLLWSSLDDQLTQDYKFQVQELAQFNHLFLYLS